MLAQLLFFFLAVVAIAAAIGMIASRNPVTSALWLILNLFCVAGLYLTMNAEFIGVVQVVVYAGAIMVLFLFVIMLLGAESLPAADVLPWQKPLAAVLAIALAVESTVIFLTRARPVGTVTQPDESVNTVTNLRALGETLFTDYLLPFEVTSILLLVAMLGAIVLVRKEKRVH